MYFFFNDQHVPCISNTYYVFYILWRINEPNLIYWFFHRSPEFTFIKGSSLNLSYDGYWVQMHLGSSLWREEGTQESASISLNSCTWEEEEWKYGPKASCVEYHNERGAGAEGLVSTRALQDMVYDVSGWETITPLLPGSFSYLKGSPLWGHTGVTDMNILMRGVVPVLEEMQSIKWTSDGGQRKRRM